MIMITVRFGFVSSVFSISSAIFSSRLLVVSSNKIICQFLNNPFEQVHQMYKQLVYPLQL